MSQSCAIYARISRDAEGDAVGVENQESAARALAERLGLTVYRVYVDNDRGASMHSRKTRPAYDEMIADAAAGRFTTLVAYSMSRVSRRPAEWESLIQLHAQTGILFKFVVSPTYDLNTADGRATARTVAAWDAAEAERTSERRRFRNDGNIAQGKPAGRPRVFGYEIDGMTPREDEAALLREGYAHVLAGGAVRSLAKAWNDAGRTTLSNRPWSTTTLRNALLRERNAGILIARGQRVEGSQITPLVDMDTWESVRAILTDSTRTQPGRREKGRPTADRWLSGAMECACGRPMLVGGSWSKRTYSPAYRCEAIAIAERTAVPRVGRHAQIVAALVEDNVPLDLFRVLLTSRATEVPEGSDVIHLRRVLSGIAAERVAAQELYMLPGADKGHLAAKIAQLGVEHEAADAQLTAALTDRAGSDLVATIRALVAEIMAAREDDERGAESALEAMRSGTVTAEALAWGEAWEARYKAFRAAWDALPVEVRKAVTASKLSIVIAPGGNGVTGYKRATVTPR